VDEGILVYLVYKREVGYGVTGSRKYEEYEIIQVKHHIIGGKGKLK
jgi:hypothetical protein